MWYWIIQYEFKDETYEYNKKKDETYEVKLHMRSNTIIYQFLFANC